MLKRYISSVIVLLLLGNISLVYASEDITLERLLLKIKNSQENIQDLHCKAEIKMAFQKNRHLIWYKKTNFMVDYMLTGEMPQEKRLFLLIREEAGKIQSYIYPIGSEGIIRKEVNDQHFNFFFGNTVHVIQQSIDSQGDYSLKKQPALEENFYILTIEHPKLGQWIYHIRESDWLVVKKINLQDGITTSTEYSNIKVNEGIPDDIFQSALPKDVPVIGQ